VSGAARAPAVTHCVLAKTGRALERNPSIHLGPSDRKPLDSAGAIQQSSPSLSVRVRPGPFETLDFPGP